MGLLSLTLVFFIYTPSWALTTVKVGMLRLSSNDPFYIGMDKGFFESEAINEENVC